VTVRLDGIDLVIFDKDGTLIDFGTMWSGWAETLAASLSGATGRPVDGPLFAMLGYDPVTRRVTPGGGMAATPMARLRERTRDVLVAEGVPAEAAESALARTWHAPDPVGLTHPLADLDGLFARLRATGRLIAVATTDDRDPTLRTFAALGLSDAIDALVCADDGVAVKPAPDMVVHLCAALDVPPARTSVVGDSPADLQMARAAGAGLVIGVLTGVGGHDDLEPLADVVLDSVGAIAAAAAEPPGPTA
jgi:phosphoglycolate phosphatase-like HAD superfamily hydrolase